MYNHELKVIDTPSKAYLLGLFYSDGCITSNDGHYSAHIVLHEKDKYLLELLNSEFPFFNINKHSDSAFKLCTNSKNVVEDLKLNGMVYRKSTENKELLRLPNLDSTLVHHFIRGYFDGDGSVYRQKLGNTKFEIGGPSFSMIADIVKALYDNKITVNLTCKYTGQGLRTQDYYCLYVSSDKLSKAFAEYIYKDCGELFLRRKFDRLYFVPEYHRPERPVCPICGGTNTVLEGKRLMRHGLMQRGKCKDCKKQFSTTAPQGSNTLSGGDELLEA